MEGHCLQAMKIVHHLANGSFHWLISGQQSVNPSREAISIQSGKYERFTFAHHRALALLQQVTTFRGNTVGKTKLTLDKSANFKFRNLEFGMICSTIGLLGESSFFGSL